MGLLDLELTDGKKGLENHTAPTTHLQRVDEARTVGF